MRGVGDIEVQGHDAVIAFMGAIVVVVVAIGGEDAAMPSVVVADGGCGVAREDDVGNSEVKAYDAVAPHDAAQRVGVVARGGVGGAVPCEAAHCHAGAVGRGAVVPYGQGKRNHAVASHGIGYAHGVVVARGEKVVVGIVGLSIGRPCVFFAGLLCLTVACVLLDGQMERDDAVKPVVGGVVMGVFATTRMACAVPYEIVACKGCRVAMTWRIVYGEVQRHGAVAARRGTQGVRVVARRGVGCAVPCVGYGPCQRGLGGGGVVDGEVQRHGAVAAGGVEGVEGGRVVALGVGGAVPRVAVASRLLL